MSIDSVACFNETVADRGLSAHLANFNTKGWHTLSDLVYATTYSPHGGCEEKFEREIVVKGLGDANHVDRPRLRRLYFEAFALVAGELRRSTEATPTTLVRVVSAPERAERRRRVEKRLACLCDESGHFEDSLDISDE